MASPNDKITRNGQTLTRRVWDLIANVGKENGVTLQISQGGFKKGDGASASAGTHDAGDVYDIRIVGMSEAKALAVVNDFREWYGDAWLRTPKYGWPASAGGPHIHVVQADSYYALSRSAQSQVVAYNNHKNGLASGASDPLPHPPRQHWPYSPPAPKPPAPSPVTVRLANLKYGVYGNNDVKDLQRALNKHNVSADLPITGNYLDQTDAAVRACQKKHDLGEDPARKSYVGPLQAKHLGLKPI